MHPTSATTSASIPCDQPIHFFGRGQGLRKVGNYQESLLGCCIEFKFQPREPADAAAVGVRGFIIEEFPAGVWIFDPSKGEIATFSVNDGDFVCNENQQCGNASSPQLIISDAIDRCDFDKLRNFFNDESKLILLSFQNGDDRPACFFGRIRSKESSHPAVITLLRRDNEPVDIDLRTCTFHAVKIAQVSDTLQRTLTLIENTITSNVQPAWREHLSWARAMRDTVETTPFGSPMFINYLDSRPDDAKAVLHRWYNDLPRLTDISARFQQLGANAELLLLHPGVMCRAERCLAILQKPENLGRVQTLSLGIDLSQSVRILAESLGKQTFYVNISDSQKDDLESGLSLRAIFARDPDKAAGLFVDLFDPLLRAGQGYFSVSNLWQAIASYHYDKETETSRHLLCRAVTTPDYAYSCRLKGTSREDGKWTAEFSIPLLEVFFYDELFPRSPTGRKDVNGLFLLSHIPANYLVEISSSTN